VSAIALVVVSPIGAMTTAAPAENVNMLNCPPAPFRWTKPPPVDSQGQPWGKMVVASGTQSGTGGDRAQVNCNYYDARGDHVDLVVNLALPSDLNPIADFYYGCSGSVTPWNSRDRTFVATSLDHWAVVAFSDPAGSLDQADVSGFEHAARQLLENSKLYAHTCVAGSKPTSVRNEYSFKFSVPGGGSATGLFWTIGSAARSRVVQVEGIRFTVRAHANGARGTLTVDVKHGLTYRLARPGSRGELMLAIRVARTNVPSCHAGATGTLTVTTAPSVALSVCGQTFLRGKAAVTISTV
jgi:hypothetical protein